MNREIEDFLNQVCAQVKVRRLHGELREELLNHLEELIQEYEQAGLGHREAVERAIQQMGSPEEIGKGLNQVHKPQFDPWMLFYMGAVLLLGGLVFISLVYDPVYAFPSSHVVLRYLSYTALGLVAGALCYLVDYTRFERYAPPVFLGGLGILLLTQLSPARINGRSYWLMGGFTIAPGPLMLPLMFLAFAGLLKRWGRGEGKGMVKLMGLSGVAILLYLLQAGLPSALLLGAGLMVMLTSTILGSDFRGKRGVYLGILYGGTMVGTIVYFMASEYRWSRLMAAFNWKHDPMGAGYIYQVIQGIMGSARWIGRSEGLYVIQGKTTQNLVLPEASTDMVFAYLVGTFGWFAGVAVILAFLFLMGRMLMISMGIHHPIHRSVALAILVVFGLQAMGSIFMNMGILPVTSLSLPFISYGGTNFIMNMMLLGIFLGIHRRKNLNLAPVR